MNLKKKKNSEYFVLQQDQRDCGVACLLSIIKYHNGNNTLENLRRLSGTNISGTTLLGLYHAALQVGFNAEGCEANLISLINHKYPCILHTINEYNLHHYVVCFEVIEKDNELKVIIGDPSKGIIYLNRKELEQIWVSKKCLTLFPNGTFKTSKEISIEKKLWIKTLIREDFSLLIIAAAIGIAMATLGLTMAIFSQQLIDDILPKKNFTKLNIGISLIFILLLFKEGLSVLRQVLLIQQSKKFNIRIIDFFFNHLLNLPKPFFDTRKIGEFTARLNDTARIQRVISQLAGNVSIDLLVTIVSTVFVFFYSWKVGVGCLVAIPIFYFLIYLHNDIVQNAQRSIMTNYAMTEANYISTLNGIDPIKNYSKQGLFTVSNNEIYQNFQDKIFALGKIQIKLSFLANSFSLLFLLSILLFGSYQVLNNHLKIGELFAILGMCSSLLPSIANLALISIPINEAKIAFDRMFEFTAIKPEDSNQNISAMEFKSLEALNLSFRFAGHSSILKDICFEIKKGEIIAILGENGSGKTTLIQILQKNNLQESGQLFINKNILIDDISILEWRKMIGVVPQNIHIFNGTVLENIAFEHAITKQQEVLDFLNQLGFLPFLNCLPQSIFTLVGEEGINLSGGQKQIIAIARALYHKPQLLILDEATSAMDRQSEQFILQLVSNQKNKMAIIFITHRLHILKSICNRIYILENGVITNSGTHHTLLENENLYSLYWNDLKFQ